MKCPNCGETVIFEEVVDTEYHDHKCYDIGYGTCPKCDKTWGWTEVFVYAKDEDIQEMKDNDPLNGRPSKIEINHKKERTRYRLRECNGTEHYVMLTPEQERFMRWNHDNYINYDSMDIDVIENIVWETP